MTINLSLPAQFFDPFILVGMIGNVLSSVGLITINKQLFVLFRAFFVFCFVSRYCFAVELLSCFFLRFRFWNFLLLVCFNLDVANHDRFVPDFWTCRFKYSHFEFMMVLAFCHYIFTSLSLHVMITLQIFEYKRCSYHRCPPLSFGLFFLLYQLVNQFPSLSICPTGALGSVAFMNLSLAFNSVGFYQISKLACVPVTLILQYLMFKEQASFSGLCRTAFSSIHFFAVLLSFVC